MNVTRPCALAVILITAICLPAPAQFVDEFNGTSLEGWSYLTGDGSAAMDFRQGDGYGSIFVDATRDRRNIWWALIKRDVSAALDLSRLSEPGQELRIEARIRVSHAPRRVNLHLNTQRTVDFHSHLMEFDIPDTLSWHTISMTTRDFEAEPGDVVNGQLALMDWGLRNYRVDVDYFKVDVVDAARIGPDEGEPLPYQPPLADRETFEEAILVAQDGMVDRDYPDENLKDWYSADDDGRATVLAVGGTQLVILRWDLGAYAGKRVAGSGLLELTTHSVQRTDVGLEEFGKIRVVEIIGGDPAWNRETVTFESLLRERFEEEVFNGQMIIDVDVSEGRGRKTLVTLSRPVLQRIVDGKTLGLVLRPLGAIHATFYSRDHADGQFGARLLFDVADR